MIPDHGEEAEQPRRQHPRKRKGSKNLQPATVAEWSELGYMSANGHAAAHDSQQNGPSKLENNRPHTSQHCRSAPETVLICHTPRGVFKQAIDNGSGGSLKHIRW